MDKIKLEFLFENAVAHILLDDGKGNVLDKMMMAELQEILDSFAGKNDLKLIIFEGSGKHFSFGASVDEHRKEMAGDMLKSFHRLFYTLRDLAIPTLAKISGQCLGGGLELAIMCNFIFADQSAKMGQPEIVLGVFPPPASVILPQKIGQVFADDLIITGRTIGAEEAKGMGLLNHVFTDKDALNEGVKVWIEKYILPKSALSLRYATKSARANFNQTLTEILPQLENNYVESLMNTHDANEGIHSFLEKRIAQWTNN